MAKQKTITLKNKNFVTWLFKYSKYFDDLHVIILIMNKNAHLIMIDWMNDKIYKFSFSCVSHLFKLERTNTDIHTILWVSYSVGHKICFQILNEATFKNLFRSKAESFDSFLLLDTSCYTRN